MRLSRPVLWVAVVLAVCCSATTAIAAVSSSTLPSSKPGLKLAGAWSGRYSGPYSGTFTLHSTQSGTRLKGTIVLSKPSGKYNIGGSVHGSSIKFGVVAAGATYTGSVSGKSMSGSYTTPQGGGKWSAHKT